jgi:hypothetical protein
MPNPCAATDEEQAQEGCEPRDELRRLHGIRKKLKIGKAGVTEGIVNTRAVEVWRNAEAVKVRYEDVWPLNMRRTHEILEVSALPCSACSSVHACKR